MENHDVIVCPNCGNQVEDTSLTFCPDCGINMHQHPYDSEAEKSEKEEQTGLLKQPIRIWRFAIPLWLLLIMGCCTLCFAASAVNVGFRSIGILPTDTPTVTPTSITNTPMPTHTPRPTNTQEPTSTPKPTNTPRPTNTPEPTSTPDRQAAQVIQVVDGDTIEVELDGQIHAVRYIGIDSPESVAPNQPVEWMSRQATEANEDLVQGKTVYLEEDVSGKDQYGRLLRYVFLADGTFVNAELVRLGYAQAKAYPPDVKYQDRLREVQQIAQNEEVGLWGPTATPLPASPTPIPPTATPAPPTSAPPTATPQVQPTITQPPQAAPGKVEITYIFYDGVVKRVESDEYAVIKNVGGSPINLGGWRLNAGDEGQDFIFPNFELQPGQACRVYTNEHHPETCGFSFGIGHAIWNNKGNCGYLYDSTGAEVSSYCY
jgi:endonuclease YncB( thermonuclease family)